MVATTVHRSLRGRRLTAGVLAIALAIVGQGFVAGREYLFDGLFLYAIALLLASRAFEPPAPAASTADDSTPIAAGDAPRWWIDRSVVVVGGLAVAANLLALGLLGANSHPSAAWVLYAISVVAAPLTVWLATGRQRPRLSRALDLGDAVALGLVLLIAAAFRLYRIDSLPFGLWWDEAYSGLRVLRIMNDPAYRPVYVAEMAQEPSLFWYLVIPSFRWFGPSALGLRIPAVVGGLLGVAGVYLLARELFGRRAGIAAAFLLAVMAWHVDFSRIAFNSIWSVALDAFTAYFLLRGLRTGRLLSFALAGTMLGLAVQMYYTSRLVPIVLLLYLLRRMAAERRAFFRLHLSGLLLFGVATLIAAGPLIQFAYLHPAEFLSRAGEVTVFREVSQQHSYAPLVDNARQHLAMFLFQGDRNGRHNLPGAPMLDQVTGALFVLGLAMALARVGRVAYFFPLAWGIVMLAGGVFSLPFEAPQGLRTIDEVTAVALLAALPIVALWERLSEFRLGDLSVIFPGGRRLVLPMVALPVLGLLGVVAAANYDRYFVRQANDYAVWSAFSTAETIIGNQIQRLGREYDVYLGETFTNHPTIEFLGGRKDLPAFAPAAQLPLSNAKDTAIFLEPDRTESVALLRELYPQAEVQTFRSPAGDKTLLYGVMVSQSQISALQGLTGSYYAAPDGTGAPTVTERLLSAGTDWGVPGLPRKPFFALWQGTLRALEYGPYRFKLEGPPGADLYLDGSKVIGAHEGQGLVLATGNHALLVKAMVTDSTPLRVLWQPPKAGQFTSIPREMLFSPPASNRGLLGSYYPNREWSGAAAFQRVDPFLDMPVHLLPLPRPYSVEWRGKIDAPRSGLYSFATESADASWVYLDDRLVATNDGANRQLREGTVRLDAGYHDLRVRFRDETDHTFLRVYWTPPGEERELLPNYRLYPPQGGYPPPLQTAVVQVSPSQAAIPSTLPVGAVKAEFLRSMAAGAVTDPRDVAISPDGRIYVVDTAAKRIAIFNPDGSPAGQLAGEFVQPFGLTVSPDGRVSVLDSLGKDPILQFGARGEPLTRFGGNAGAYSPRGLFLDAGGNLYLADTGRSRVLKLSPTGQVMAEFRAGGQLAQPVSVAVDRNGTLYVVDGEKQQLLVVGPNDAVQRSWPVAPNTTFDAPHLALGPRGEIYLSDPRGNAIDVFDSQGKAIGRVGTSGGGDGQFSLPTGIHLDGHGGLWVADTGNRRVQLWTNR